MLINGVPQAAYFPGAPDACLQVRNAAQYAITYGITEVDASGIGGTQTCNTDMFGALASITTNINLHVRFGPVHFQTTVEQTVTNSNIWVEGAGRLKTLIEYTGTSAPTDGTVFYLHAQNSGVSQGLTAVLVSGIGVYGKANVTNALQTRDVNRSAFRDVFVWGATGDGGFFQGDVTTTMDNVKASNADAALLGIYNDGIHHTPTNGLEFAKSFASNNQCTDSTVTDAAAESVTGTGWLLTSASNMSFSGGTSEGNLQGIVVVTNSKWNTFFSPDLEGNALAATGVDVTDNGGGNVYIAVLATSGAGAGNSMVAGGSGGQVIVGDSGYCSQLFGIQRPGQ
jgi:hypothetical protein